MEPEDPFYFPFAGASSFRGDESADGGPPLGDFGSEFGAQPTPATPSMGASGMLGMLPGAPPDGSMFPAMSALGGPLGGLGGPLGPAVGVAPGGSGQPPAGQLGPGGPKVYGASLQGALSGLARRPPQPPPPPQFPGFPPQSFSQQQQMAIPPHMLARPPPEPQQAPNQQAANQHAVERLMKQQMSQQQMAHSGMSRSDAAANAAAAMAATMGFDASAYGMQPAMQPGLQHPMQSADLGYSPQASSMGGDFDHMPTLDSPMQTPLQPPMQGMDYYGRPSPALAPLPGPQGGGGKPSWQQPPAPNRGKGPDPANAPAVAKPGQRTRQASGSGSGTKMSVMGPVPAAQQQQPGPGAAGKKPKPGAPPASGKDRPGPSVVLQPSSHKAATTPEGIPAGAAAGPVTISRHINSVINHFTSSKEGYRRLLQELDDLLFVLTPEGAIIYASPSAKRTLGYGPEELTGRPILDFCHPDDAALVGEELEASVRRAADTAYHARFAKKGGEYVLMEVRGKPYGKEQLRILGQKESRTGSSSNGGQDDLAEPADGPGEVRFVVNTAREYRSKASLAVDGILELSVENLKLRRQLERALRDKGVDPASHPLLKEAENELPPSMLPSELFESAGLDMRDRSFAAAADAGFGSGMEGGNGTGGEDKEGGEKKKAKKGGAEEIFCRQCGTTSSPEWRRGPDGPKTLCNACGLAFAKKTKKATKKAEAAMADSPPPPKPPKSGTKSSKPA